MIQCLRGRRMLWPVLCVLHYVAPAQTTRPSLADDTLRLDEVVVTGYATNRRLLETAASVGLLTSRDLNTRFGTPTLVPAFNTLPGVRLDERSPGSYRLSIRGSLIRSPFGVRNVKVYWNELPLTDAGGNTPLNALDVRTLGRVEVIKGPSGSLYGAGTGGTVLFSGLAVTPGETRAEASALVGSYGLYGNGLTVQTANARAALSVSYNHLQSRGYRQHSALVRDNLNLTGTVQLAPKQTLSVLGLYSDLAYQTPGGLTAAQYATDRRQSRPATRTLPGSAEQRAGVYQKLAYAGLVHEYRWNDRVQTTTALYGSLTDFANPFITNYEKRTDRGGGGRSVTQVRVPLGRVATTWSVGGEWQQNATRSTNFGNRRGQPDTLQTDDRLRARQALAFVQVEATLPAGFILTTGLSLNGLRYVFRPLSTPEPTEQQRQFRPVWLPRVALSKTLLSDGAATEVVAFVNLSTGYSAPGSQEVRPSEGTFNTTLEAERGLSWETGLRGRAGRLTFDVVAYGLQLRETIVRRSADNGAEFFLNAGRTDQRGLEAQLSYDLRATTYEFRVWNSLTLTNYRFRTYRQGSVDASGKRVPGVAPVTNVVGADFNLKAGPYAYVTYQFLNPFPLDDANTVRAAPTRILTATAGVRRTLGKRWTLDAYLSGDNLLNQPYVLGYDLNAFGGRYYNAAPLRNWVAGTRVSLRW